MEEVLNFIINKINVAVVIVSWVIFSIGFLTLKRKVTHKAKDQDRRAIIGFLLEVIGYALVFGIRREIFSDIIQLSLFFAVLFAFVNAGLACLSLWMTLAAVKTLGKQWDMRARIIEGHELIVSGPYRIVRHPIYSGMFGLLIITGFSISQWWALLIAIVLYFIGTIFRTTVEEGLLIEHFGEKYVEYKKAVPAIIPFIY